MADITKSSDSSTYQRKIIYDAYSNPADVWMRNTYGRIQIEFSLEDVSEIRDFEARAKAAGLTVSGEW